MHHKWEREHYIGEIDRTVTDIHLRYDLYYVSLLCKYVQ